MVLLSTHGNVASEIMGEKIKGEKIKGTCYLVGIKLLLAFLLFTAAWILFT